MQGKDYLTETHKLRDVYRRYKVSFYLGMGLVAFLFFYGFCEKMVLQRLWYTEEERVFCKQNKARCEEPFMFSVFHFWKVLKKKESLKDKVVVVMVYVGVLLGSLSPVLVLMYVFWRKRSFFYVRPILEEPLVLKNRVVVSLDYILGIEGREDKEKIKEELFNDVGKVERILNSGVSVEKFLIERKQEFNRFVKIFEREYRKYLEMVYGFEEEEKKGKAVLLIRFLLWHYLINLMGNVPTGLLSSYVKDDDLRLCLSCYQRKLLPLIYVKERVGGVHGEIRIKIVKERIFAYLVLRAFYEVFMIDGATKEGLYDVLDKKFSVLPFRNPVQLR